MSDDDKPCDTDKPLPATSIFIHIHPGGVQIPVRHQTKAPVTPTPSEISARVTIDDLRRKNANLDDLVTKLQAERDALHAEHSALRKELDTLRAEHSALEKEAMAVFAERERLRKGLEVIEGSLSRIEQHIKP